MKPSWDDAPEWAEWLAKDENGKWYWYEEEPRFDGEVWRPKFGSMSREVGGSAEQSLEPRP